MNHYKPYPAYKDSGVEWLGQVPAHWDVTRVKYAIRSMGQGWSPECEARPANDGEWGVLKVGCVNGGVFRPAENKALPTTLTPRLELALKKGDVLVSRANTRELVGGCAVVERDFPLLMICDKLYRLNVDQTIAIPAFLAALIAVHGRREVEFEATGASASMVNIAQSVIANLQVGLPPIDEQIAILAAVTSGTQRYDALISKKTSFIELLREKRQALITHAVTKGFDPNASMKDSGVEWLGDVPAHWDVTRVKYVLSSIGQGWSPECESRPVDDGEWGVLKVGCVNGGVFRPTENKALPLTLAPRPELALKKGDVLVSRANTRELVGGCAVVEQDFPSLMICDKLYRLSVDNARTNPAFLAALIAVHGRREVELEATGASASMVNIAQSVILNLQVGLPPLDEQVAIIVSVVSGTQRYDTLISTTERSIELLKERRSALITAAVTGQIDLLETV